MAVLGNSRHEAGARTLAGGGTAEAAAAAAGYDIKASSFKSNARKFIQRPDIQERVRELQGQLADKMIEVTAESVIQVFARIASVRVADEHVKASDVIAAARELAKILGIYAPEKIAPTDPTGTAAYDPNAISDEDRVKLIDALYAKVKA